MTRDRLAIAEERIRFARMYTKQFVDDLNDEDWFWTPPGFVTHIAWQIAHIAASQYGLCLFRLRGRTEADEVLIPQAFWDNFKIGSKPVAGPRTIRRSARSSSIFDNVLCPGAHRTRRQDRRRSRTCRLSKPHPAFSTVLGGIEYSPMHETDPRGADYAPPPANGQALEAVNLMFQKMSFRGALATEESGLFSCTLSGPHEA